MLNYILARNQNSDRATSERSSDPGLMSERPGQTLPNPPGPSLNELGAPLGTPRTPIIDQTNSGYQGRKGSKKVATWKSLKFVASCTSF